MSKWNFIFVVNKEMPNETKKSPARTKIKTPIINKSLYLIKPINIVIKPKKNKTNNMIMNVKGLKPLIKDITIGKMQTNKNTNNKYIPNDWKLSIAIAQPSPCEASLLL